MTPTEIYAARRRLGELWGLDRPLFVLEMARALRMSPASAGKTIGEWESGKSKPSGPVQVALTMMLAGAQPPDLSEIQANAAVRSEQAASRRESSGPVN